MHPVYASAALVLLVVGVFLAYVIPGNSIRYLKDLATRENASSVTRNRLRFHYAGLVVMGTGAILLAASMFIRS